MDVNDPEINDESIVTILNSLGNSGMKILLFEDIDTAFAEKEKMTNEIKIEENRVNNYNDYVDYLDNNDTRVPRRRRHHNSNPNLKQKQIQIDLSPSQDDDNTPTSLAGTTTTTTITKYLTYSGLLNALDGVMSDQNGVITIMTTNYIERLGVAFLRPGRIDCKFEMKECTKDQIIHMTTNFVQKRIELEDKLFEKCVSTRPVYANVDLKKFENDIDNFATKLCNGNIYSKIKPCDLQVYLLKYIDTIENIFENIDVLLRI
jgi:hypothetical protein